MRKWVWVGILILAGAVRLLTLSKLLVFTPDEAYISYIVRTIVKDFHVIWIGVSILGYGFYMGPLWIYIIYPFYALLNGDPMVLGALTSLMGVATTFLIYWLGKKMFNGRVAIIASLFYATQALVIFYDQRPYPPGVPMWLMLMMLSLYMSNRSSKWWIFFAFLAGMVFHIHLSLGGMILVGIYWAYVKRKSIGRSVILPSILVFTITISPLIVFDYFHKASNITTPLRILKSSQGGGFSLNFAARANSFWGTLSRVWYLTPGNSNADEILYPCNVQQSYTTTDSVMVLPIVALVIYILFLFNKRTWTDEKKKLLALAGLATLFPFLFLPIFNPVEYYLVGFFPIFFLTIALFVDSLKSLRKYAYILIIIVAFNGIFTVIGASGNYGLEERRMLISKVEEIVGEKTYELETADTKSCLGGWRYLFLSYYKAPLRSTEDKNLAWLYPEEVSKVSAEFKVKIKESRLATPTLQGDYLIQMGGFSAYVSENR